MNTCEIKASSVFEYLWHSYMLFQIIWDAYDDAFGCNELIVWMAKAEIALYFVLTYIDSFLVCTAQSLELIVAALCNYLEWNEMKILQIT